MNIRKQILLTCKQNQFYIDIRINIIFLYLKHYHFSKTVRYIKKSKARIFTTLIAILTTYIYLK